MLEFRDIELSDREKINKALKESDFMGCEYSFANNFAWRRLNDTKICFLDDFYICADFKGEYPVFAFPAGKGDYKKLIAEMKKFVESKNAPLTIACINNETLQMLNETFPDMFDSTSDIDIFDYIYKKDDLLNLAGKKYHQKRNHLSKFYNNNDWSFEPISENNYDECIEFAVNNYNFKNGYESDSGIAEQFAINAYFNFFKELELKGGVIRVNGKVEAITIGEKINSDTFCVHIEKANPDIQGCYPAINKEFVAYAAGDCEYINREEDLGIEGLRKAKKSYYPCFMLEKNIVTFRK